MNAKPTINSNWQEKRDSAYKRACEAYFENEGAYWEWAELWRLFYQRVQERYYYKKGVPREKRKQLCLQVLADFPNASWREVHSQTGGCREILWEFSLWETPHDHYWIEGDKWTIYTQLKKFPDEIYEAIEEPYEWSKKFALELHRSDNLYLKF